MSLRTAPEIVGRMRALAERLADELGDVDRAGLGGEEGGLRRYRSTPQRKPLGATRGAGLDTFLPKLASLTCGLPTGIDRSGLPNRMISDVLAILDRPQGPLGANRVPRPNPGAPTIRSLQGRRDGSG